MGDTMEMFATGSPTPIIITGKVEEVCPRLAEASFDAVLCDPPYGLSFMSKGWDHSVPSPDLWAEVLRVAKPGAFLMAFGGTRLFHRTVCGIEDGGWEVRDTIAWMFGTGFPKSLDISKAIDKAAGAEREVVGVRPTAHPDADNWGVPGSSGSSGVTNEVLGARHDNVLPGGVREVTAAATDDAQRWEGYGTALKPAHEPICLAQKPREGTYAANALEHGCGGLAIDASRIEIDAPIVSSRSVSFGDTGAAYGGGDGAYVVSRNTQGRWPANVILDEEAAAVLDAQSGWSASSPSARRNAAYTGGYSKGADRARVSHGHLDSAGASRFFYCPKASRKEREAGLDNFGESVVDDGRHTPNDTAYQRGKSKRKNTHPTVKPIDLIRYLARLILPPPREDGAPRRILVPFSGSGSEVIGCLLAGWDEVVGIEMSEEYAEIARARIEHWRKEAK